MDFGYLYDLILLPCASLTLFGSDIYRFLIVYNSSTPNIIIIFSRVSRPFQNSAQISQDIHAAQAFLHPILLIVPSHLTRDTYTHPCKRIDTPQIKWPNNLTNKLSMDLRETQSIPKHPRKSTSSLAAERHRSLF